MNLRDEDRLSPWNPDARAGIDMDASRFDVIEFHEVRITAIGGPPRPWRATCKCGASHPAWSEEAARAWADEHVGNT